MVNIFRNLIFFFQRPQDDLILEDTSRFKLVFYLLLIDLPVIIFLEGLIQYFFNYFSLKNNNQLFTLTDYLPLSVFFLLIVVAIPLLEELIFRLPLKQRSNPLYLFAKLFEQLRQGALIKFQSFWRQHYFWIFYGFLAAFTLLHLMNFKVQEIQFYYIPVLILGLTPIFITGFLISYIRLQAGFKWGVIFHGLHNLFALTIVFGFLGSPEERFLQTTKDYQLKIEKAGSPFYNKKGLFKGDDTLAFQNYKLQDLLTEISGKERILEAQKEIQSEAINLYYKNRSANEIDKRTIYEGLEKGLNLNITEEEKTVNCIALKSSEKPEKSTSLYAERSGNYSEIRNINYTKLTNPSNHDIVQLLNSRFQNRIFCPPIEKFFIEEFKLNKKADFQDLQQQLKKKKVLYFDSVKRKIQFLMINPS